ncbi:MAG: glycosyltransferase family 4 protein [Chloroflexota bacterium]
MIAKAFRRNLPPDTFSNLRYYPHMHIGLLIYGSLDTISGGYLYDRKLGRHLHEQGHDVEIFSLPWRNYGAHLRDNFSRSLFRRLVDAPLDILLQDELNHPSLFWLNGRLKPHITYPIISIVHHLRIDEQHLALWQPLYQAVERRYLRSIDGFIFNSQTTKQGVQQLVGDKRPSVVAQPAGDRFAPLSKTAVLQKTQQDGPLKLLFVGNVTPRKGLHTLIQALGRLPKERWTLDVVGSLTVDPAYANRWLVKETTVLDIQKRITVYGQVNDTHLENLYTRNHLLVVPSQYEGFGIVYLEGMAFGCPAIGSTAGAAHEIITPAETGYLIEPEDTVVLAQHLQALIDDRALLTQLATAAHARFLEHPAWETSMAKIETFISDRF